jgi:N-acyl-D-aspartate/D-glutamate deacylase
MPQFEIAIRGARVLDGTGNPWYRADLGVAGGRLVFIGDLGSSDAQRSIDADGLVVCPGFIDLHTHSDMPLLVDGDARSKVHQGVTLDVIGESNSVTPVVGPAADEYADEQRHRFGVDVDWTDLDGYFARLLRGGTSMNVASSVAPQQVRRAVVGFTDRPSSADETQAMVDLVRQAMEQGAVGLCSAWHGGGYEHFDELAAMAREAARHGGYYGTHMGNEGGELFTELDKALAIGRAANIPVHIYHLKARGRTNWGKVGQVIDTIEAARREGLEVTANQYPYTAMQHPWRRLVPRWIQDAPRHEMLPRFRDPAFRARVRQDEEFQRNVLEHGDWPNIVMSQVVTASLKPLEGKTVAQIAELRGAPDPVELCFDLIAEEGAFPGGVYHTMSEDDVRQVMRVPWVSIGSDGSALSEQAPGYPHPRSFGTNVRVLGRYVREEGVLRLEDAVRKMTGLPAQVLRLRDRGLLREGYWADVVVFDPERVADRATFDNPKQYAAGVEYVLVNGQLVIDGGRHTGARPGQAILGRGARATVLSRAG